MSGHEGLNWLGDGFRLSAVGQICEASVGGR